MSDDDNQVPLPDLENNGGVLAVDMSIFDASDSLIHSWTLSNPADLISAVGGNRYGWFDFNEFPFLAIDNAEMNVVQAAVPEPASLALWGCGMLAAAAVSRRRRRVA